MLILTPSEQARIRHAINTATSRYQNHKGVMTARHYGDMLTDLLHQAGFIAAVNTDPTSPDNYDLTPDGNHLIYRPNVHIIDRVTPTATDHEKVSWETQKAAGYKVDPFTGEKKAVD